MTKVQPLIAAMLIAWAGPAAAQLPGGLPSLPGGSMAGGLVGGVTGDTRRLTDGGLLRPAGELLGALDPTRTLGRDLLRRNSRLLEADDAGRPVVRGEITAVGMSQAALALARDAGFELRGRERIAGLDFETAVLGAPRGMSAKAALRRLRELDPGGQYDFNHIYFESGAAGPGDAAPASPAAASGRGLRIGLVDGSVQAGTKALASTPPVQRAFGPGGAKVSPHATAVGSLIAGEDGAFRGAAPGATLYVADVYGPTPAGGSALAVARGLGWLAEQGVPVINVSLVGPPNRLLEAAVASVTRRGHLVVAAVGNDGPAAPPLYPAAYPGVVGVTGLDGRRRALPEAGRGPQVDFAAPGSDLAAAGSSGGYVRVRGTSYAAPFVAALLARALFQPDPGLARRALEQLAREAADLGAKGPDPVFGRGGVALDLATPPARVAAK
jgi:hypothetical protein